MSRIDWVSLSALLFGALTVMFGLQLLRMLFVGMAVYLTQVQVVDPVLVGALGLVVFLCGFLAPVVRRALGPRIALPSVVGLLTLVWLSEKFVSSLPIGLGLSIADVDSVDSVIREEWQRRPRSDCIATGPFR